MRLKQVQVTAIVLVSLGTVSSSAEGPSDKGPTYRRNRGQIIFSAQPFGTPATEKDFAQMVGKARRALTLAADKDGRWQFNFIAFLRQSPGAEKVNLVWYKLGKQREQVDYLELVVPADGVTLRAKATLSPGQFSAGDKLEGRITRLIGGKEKVYARCRLTLTK